MAKNSNKSDQSSIRSKKQIYVFFKLQYLHRITTQIEKEIRDFLKHYEIRLIMSHSITTQIEKEIRDFLKHYETRLIMSHSTFNIGKSFP